MQSYFGYIYIPKNKKTVLDSENDKPFSEVKYDLIEGVKLYIDGNDFWVEAGVKKYGIEQYNLIKGAFSGLGYVTLLECNVIAAGTGIGGSETKLSCKYIITKIQVDNEEKLNFSQLYVIMPSLRSWFNKRIFDQVNVYDESFSLIKHDPIVLTTFEEFTLEIGFIINHNLNREKGLSINDSAILKIKARNNNLSLWDLIDIYKKFKKFIAFIGFFDEAEDIFSLYDKEIKYENIEQMIEMKFYTKQYNFKNNGIDAIKKINYDFIEQNIEVILHNWYNVNDLSDSIDLILEKYFHPKLSLESFFLNSCFAIEIFHRRFKKNNRYSKPEFKRIKNEILSKIDDLEVKSFFENKLAHANEPSFRERLESLNDDLKLVLPYTIDSNELIKSIVNTRNNIVHRSSCKGVISGLELYYASFYLEALTKLCVFKELGFNQNHINAMFTNTREQIESMYHLNRRIQTGIKKK